MASSVVALAGHVMVVAGLTQMVRPRTHRQGLTVGRDASALHGARSLWYHLTRRLNSLVFFLIKYSIAPRIIASLSVYTLVQSWMTMWAGRAIFGIGTEALCVACRILIARWFMGREMALSMGVILAFGRFGSVINDNISALYDGQHVVGAWCIGALICTFSVLASLVAVWIDRDHELRWKEKYGIGGDTKEAAKGELKEVEEEGLASNKKAAAAAAYSDGDSTSVSSFGGISSSPAAASCCGNSAYFDSVDGSASSTTAGSVPLLAADSLESGNCCGGGDADPSSGGSNQQRRQQSSSDDTNNSNSSSTASAPKKVSMLADVCSFGPAYWILAPISLMGFPCITSFNGVASAFLTQRWIDEGQPHDTARVNAVMGILYTVAACLALFVGSVIDRAGRRAVFMASALCFVCLTHLLFAVTTAPAEALLVMLGLSFAVYAAAFWPSIAFVTPASAFGTAYGMMGAIQNAGLATVPLIISQLQPPHCSGSYQCVELMLTGMAATGVVLCCVAHVLERRHAAAVAAKDGASAASSSSSSSNGGSGSTSMSAKSIDDSVGLIARLRASLRRLVPALMGEAKMASDDFSDALEMQSSGAGGYARLPKEESDADFDR